MKKYVIAAASLFGLLMVYLLLWSVPVSPVSWDAPATSGYVEAHSPNTKLGALRMLSLGSEEGPEHVAMGPEGRLYVAVASGKILRMRPDKKPAEADQLQTMRALMEQVEGLR